MVSTAELGIEDLSLAQFWYSANTTRVLIELCQGCSCVAFLSTPSVFFALSEDMQESAVLFEFDRKWDGNPRFRFFDYKAPLSELNSDFQRKCDLIIADPPRIQPAVVDKYIEVAKELLVPDGRIVLTTAMENEFHLAEQHGLFSQVFIPKASAAWAELGRFRLYTNFAAPSLKKKNLEDFSDDTDDDCSGQAYNWVY